MALPWARRGPGFQKPCACLVGRDEQSNIEEAAPAERMSLKTCHEKGAVGGKEESLQRVLAGNCGARSFNPSRVRGRAWVEKEILVLSNSRGRK